MNEGSTQSPGAGSAPDAANILRRRWFRIIPIAFIMYTIAYIDRINISLCLPALRSALGNNPVQAGNVAGVFFWGYLLLQLPGGHLARVWSAKRVISILLVAWGCCAVSMGFVSTWRELWVARLLLGVAEGGVFPATIVLLANWFGQKERARANSYWMLCQPGAVIVSSPFTGYILGRWGWQAVFIIEGCLPFICLIVWHLRIDDTPQEARWISEEGRSTIAECLQRDIPKPVPTKYASTLRAVIGRQVCLMVAMSVLINCGAYGFLFWLPSALFRARTLSPLSVSILSTLPFIVAGVAMVVNARDSDRSGDRRVHVAAPLVVSGLSFLAAALIGRGSFVLYIVLLCLAGAGIYASIGPAWAIPTETLPKPAVGLAVGLINSLGSLGGYFGPVVVGVLSRGTGDFGHAFVVLSCGLLAAAGIALALE
jgi:MFS family permease